MELTCFKAYDVRGTLGDELNEDIARRIGRAYGIYLKPQKVVVGGDARISSSALKAALTEGLREVGIAVLDIGLCGTEEIYFATFSQNLDGGIMVTGSHNPITDNGMKFVMAESKPISGDSGLDQIKFLAGSDNRFSDADLKKGPPPKSVSFRDEYINHLLSYINVANLRPMTIVADSGNGAAGPVVDSLEKALAELGAPITFVKINHQPDGNFPAGIPNPLLPENRARTSEAVLSHKADMGLAWDGDFDRCFFFDEKGNFIEGYYLVGLLATTLMATTPGAAIIHDPRLTWNTIDLVKKAGGIAIESKTGHAFIKEAMRREKALYGGEMSAHHYFRKFSYCDSGMIPWLVIAELMGREKKTLSTLVAERQAAYPCSGEINYKVKSVQSVLARVEAHYQPKSPKISRLDGLSLEFSNWRFNLRGSNTEPLLRLNLETKGESALLSSKLNEIESLIRESS